MFIANLHNIDDLIPNLFVFKVNDDFSEKNYYYQ